LLEVHSLRKNLPLILFVTAQGSEASADKIDNKYYEEVATVTGLPQNSASAAQAQRWLTENGSLARQPILDSSGSVFAYELIVQSTAQGEQQESGALASQAVLDTIVYFGLPRLAGGLHAFVRCASEAITEGLVKALPPDQAVLEISSKDEVTEQLLEACRNLKQDGYQIAVVDFGCEGGDCPLLEVADYIKINLSGLDPESYAKLIAQVKPLPAIRIATEIGSQELYRRAQEDGFSYFQGYFFCHPELIRGSRIPANKMTQVGLLRELQREPLDFRKLSPLVQRDASLVFRLLRLVNSPMCAVRQEVTSIDTAIMLLGEATFRRIANVAVAGELNANQSEELLHMALIRAHFCELGAQLCNLVPGEQFFLGMFSMLPAMLRHSIETIAAELPLREEIRKALLGADTPERALLSWIEAHEKNDLATCHALSERYQLNQQRLIQFYVDALVWDATAPRVSK